MKNKSCLVRLFSLCLVLFFFLSLFILPLSKKTVEAKPANISMGNCVWMHIDTFFNQNNAQINNFANTLKLSKITTVLILAKNIDGTITYPSRVGTKSYKNNKMENFVALMKSNQIKVFFYFPINTDPSWIQKNNQDVAYQAGTKGSKIPIPDPAKKLINLTSKNYRNYIVELINEAVLKYSIDGIQLDYIRYTNGLSGFSKEELSLANQRKIPVSKIIDLTYQTFLDPGDWKTILRKYDESDPDVLAWAKLREDIIFDFTQHVVSSVKVNNLEIGCSLVSSGANEKAYTAIHFGQNWEKMSTILNFVTPMAYHGSRNDVKKFVEDICIGALSKINPSCKISIGIQANSTSTEKMMEAIQTAKKFNLGFVLFRVGTFAFSCFDFYPLNKEQTTVRMLFHNNVEEKLLKGFEIKNTGNILSILNCPLTCNVISQNETKIHLLFAKAITMGELLSIDIVLNWNFEKSKTMFSPIIVVTDEKNEFPSFNVSFFSLDQMIIDLSEQSILYDKSTFDNSIKFEKGKTWISLNTLQNLLGFKITNYPDSIIVTQRSNRFIIYRNEKKGKIFLSKDDTFFWITDPLFFDEEGYLPLLETMNLFRIQISYNQQEKKVFCTSLSRNTPGSIYCKWNQVSSLELFITDSSEVMIDLDDFLASSFYVNTSVNHLSGRSVRIILKEGKFSVEEIESLIDLITDEKLNFMIPDSFAYFLNQNTDWNEIPSNREIITNNQEASYLFSKKGYSTNFVMTNGDNFPKENTSKIYLSINNRNMQDRILFIPYESRITRNLYSLSSLKF